MKNDLCYIIIIHFNNYKSTFSCIESILKSDNLNFHIVIVNNNVLTDSFKDLKKTFSNNKDISLLNLNANLGYAGGLNKGIKFSLNNPDCKYLWLLNNDVYISKNSLNELIIQDQFSKNNAIIGSKVLNTNNTIQSLGCKLNKFNMVTYHNYKNCNNNKDYYDIRNIDYIHGCSMFFRKDIINIVGYFEEKYFLYYEDVDYCLRASCKNVSLIIAQKSEVFHKENTSVKKTNFQYLSTVNRIVFAKKFFKNYLILVYIYIIKDILKNFILFRISRNFQIIRFLFS